MKEENLLTDMRDRISDIYNFVKWQNVAKLYFDKSSSWLYHKFDGKDGNGNEGGFTQAEKDLFADALYDLADRLRKVADNIR